VKEFGDLVRERRHEMGLSLQQLKIQLLEQKDLRVSRTFLNFLETGKKKPPYDLAIALASVLGINVKEALRAAYSARAKYDRDRERGYLQRALEDNKLSNVKLEEIVTQRETDFTE